MTLLQRRSPLLLLWLCLNAWEVSGLHQAVILPVTNTSIIGVIGRTATTGPMDSDDYSHNRVSNQTELFLLGMDGNLDELPLGYRILATVVHTFIFCFGVVGNILLIVVAHKAKSLQTPTYCYLVSLAYADLLVILTAVPEAIVFHNIGKQWLLGQAGCAIFVYLNFLGINAGSLSILAFTVERFIAICRPLLAQTLCTLERTKKVITITWTFTLLYCSPWLGLTKVRVDEYQPDREQCEFRLSKELYIIVFGADLVLFYLVPLGAAVVVYTKIGKILYHSIRVLKWDGSASRITTRSSLDSTGSNTAIIYRRSQNTANSQSLLSRQATSAEHQVAWTARSRVQILRMLMVIVILFAVAWLPFRGLLVYNTFVEEPWLDIWYLFFAKTLIYCNSAMNPFLYNAMSRRFRAAVYETMCRKPEKLHRNQRSALPFTWKAAPIIARHQALRKQVIKSPKSKSSVTATPAQSPILNQQLDLFHCHYVPHVAS